jgi:hypothetical protein
VAVLPQEKRLVDLPKEKHPELSLKMMLCWPHSRSENCGKEKNACSRWESKPCPLLCYVITKPIELPLLALKTKGSGTIWPLG